MTLSRARALSLFRLQVTATAEFLTSTAEVQSTALSTARGLRSGSVAGAGVSPLLSATIGGATTPLIASNAPGTPSGAAATPHTKQQKTVMRNCLSVRLETSLIVPKLRVSISDEEIDNSGEVRRRLLSERHEAEELRKLKNSGYDADAETDATQKLSPDILAFAVKSTHDSTHATYNRSVTLTNETSAMIEFAVAVEGECYLLVDAVASAPQPKLLVPTAAQIAAYTSTSKAPPTFAAGLVASNATERYGSARVGTRRGTRGSARKAPIPLFQLPPQASVMTVVKFKPAKKSMMRTRGVKLKQEQPVGQVHVTFANGVEQNVSRSALRVRLRRCTFARSFCPPTTSSCSVSPSVPYRPPHPLARTADPDQGGAAAPRHRRQADGDAL